MYLRLERGNAIAVGRPRNRTSAPRFSIIGGSPPPYTHLAHGSTRPPVGRTIRSTGAAGPPWRCRPGGHWRIRFVPYAASSKGSVALQSCRAGSPWRVDPSADRVGNADRRSHRIRRPHTEALVHRCPRGFFSRCPQMHLCDSPNRRGRRTPPRERSQPCGKPPPAEGALRPSRPPNRFVHPRTSTCRCGCACRRPRSGWPNARSRSAAARAVGCPSRPADRRPGHPPTLRSAADGGGLVVGRIARPKPAVQPASPLAPPAAEVPKDGAERHHLCLGPHPARRRSIPPHPSPPSPCPPPPSGRADPRTPPARRTAPWVAFTLLQPTAS